MDKRECAAARSAEEGRRAYADWRRSDLERANFRFWVYRAGGCEVPGHAEFDGLAIPPSEPFWRVYYPAPTGICECYVLGGRSEKGIRRLGGDPEKALPDWALSVISK